MMNLKVEAIKRIMDVAESSAFNAAMTEAAREYSDFVSVGGSATMTGSADENTNTNDHDIINDSSNNNYYDYKDAKNYSQIITKYSEHFGGDVNLDYSAVHVPTTVYGRSKESLKAIKWSDTLDRTFKWNYQQDPSLSWQYFGSSTGFMRHYPAIHWKPNGSNPHDPDLFDCRTRNWYIEAATSPKDVLILVDISGSMTGMRVAIARHVVNNILDTLGNNDYVNIIKFSNITEYVSSSLFYIY